MRLRTLFLVIVILGLSFLLGMFFYSAYKGPYTAYRIRKERIRNAGIRVEVLNGTGERGVSRRIAFYLRELGFDVVYYGNAKEKLDKTVVVERIDPELKNAKIVARELGCNLITYEPDPNKLLEVTVLVGKDYKTLLKDLKEYIF